LRVSAADLDCTVQAGVRRNQLNQHLRDQGLFFPIDPGADATIGGMASTRASGTNAVRYGTMKENVIALTVVTPTGKKIVTSRRARKSSAGYDLTHLFVGAEGTLGLITEVTLKLYGVPECIASATCAFESLDGAVRTVVETMQMGISIARAEILDDAQMRAINRWSKTDLAERDTLFLEFHGTERGVGEQVELVSAIARENGGGDLQWASAPEDRTRLWKARHDALYASVGLRPGARGWATDVCVPISRLVECIALTKQDIARSEVTATILGHVGDGNFHVIFVVDPASAKEMEEATRINDALVKRAIDMDGTCTGEHGIGLGKQEWLGLELGDAVELMRDVKRALDPHCLMNPGKIFQ
jgi:D-lactate dehydrogenase (cytochrome)